MLWVFSYVLNIDQLVMFVFFLNQSHQEWDFHINFINLFLLLIFSVLSQPRSVVCMAASTGWLTLWLSLGPPKARFRVKGARSPGHGDGFVPHLGPLFTHGNQDGEWSQDVCSPALTAGLLRADWIPPRRWVISICQWKVLVSQSYLTPWNSMDLARQVPLTIEFSRQEYWSG